MGKQLTTAEVRVSAGPFESLIGPYYPDGLEDFHEVYSTRPYDKKIASLASAALDLQKDSDLVYSLGGWEIEPMTLSKSGQVIVWQERIKFILSVGCEVWMFVPKKDGEDDRPEYQTAVFTKGRVSAEDVEHLTHWYSRLYRKRVIGSK